MARGPGVATFDSSDLDRALALVPLAVAIRFVGRADNAAGLAGFDIAAAGTDAGLAPSMEDLESRAHAAPGLIGRYDLKRRAIERTCVLTMIAVVTSMWRAGVAKMKRTRKLRRQTSARSDDPA